MRDEGLRIEKGQFELEKARSSCENTVILKQSTLSPKYEPGFRVEKCPFRVSKISYDRTKRLTTYFEPGSHARSQDSFEIRSGVLI